MKQLLGIIKTLPQEEKTFLKTYIEKDMAKKKQTPLTNLLLSGPTMSEGQYQSYLHMTSQESPV